MLLRLFNLVVLLELYCEGHRTRRGRGGPGLIRSIIKISNSILIHGNHLIDVCSIGISPQRPYT